MYFFLVFIFTSELSVPAVWLSVTSAQLKYTPVTINHPLSGPIYPSFCVTVLAF